MKKRILALALAMLMLVVLVAACGGDDDDNGGGGGGGGNLSATYEYPTGPRGEGETIYIYGFTNELYNAIERYKELNPDFLYELDFSQFTDWNGDYEQALNATLNSKSNMPDLFFVEQAFVVNYTKYDYPEFAMPYDELLGIDAKAAANAAGVPAFIQDAGTNLDGKLVGLGFQQTGSAFIYRRDLAIEIWDTDEPAEIAKKIGPGYEQFEKAAAEAKEKGIAMISGEGDLWQAIRQSPEPWIVDGKLTINAQRESYLDIGYSFYNNDYTNKTDAWQGGWFADMSGTGASPVLGFLGPAWLINYTIAQNTSSELLNGGWAICDAPVPFAWGGTWNLANAQGNPNVKEGVAELVYWITLDTSDSGFQYGFANNTLYEGSKLDNEYANNFRNGASAKDMVSLKVVQDRSDATVGILKGQDMATVFGPAGATGSSTGWGKDDRAIQASFGDWAIQYFMGNCTRDEAIANFKQEMKDTLGYDS